jgi:hypothetical protein
LEQKSYGTTKGMLGSKGFWGHSLAPPMLGSGLVFCMSPFLNYERRGQVLHFAYLLF